MPKRLDLPQTARRTDSSPAVVSNELSAWRFCRIVIDSRLHPQHFHARVVFLKTFRRPALPRPEICVPNRLYWLTDRTPHESLPLEKTQRRQFFRLVSSEVSVWYSKHSTPNPLGVKADCKIVNRDKFTGEEWDGGHVQGQEGEEKERERDPWHCRLNLLRMS